MKILVFESVLILLVTQAGFASSHSTLIQGRSKSVPQSLQAFVDMKDCTKPLRSTPYLIIAGNGGANMKLTCPIDKPVMYGWRQQVGFVGAYSVMGGGGSSWITCCAIGHNFQAWADPKKRPAIA